MAGAGTDHCGPDRGPAHLTRPARPPLALGPAQHADLLRAPAGLREHAFWRLLADTGAAAEEILALNADHLDLAGHRTRISGLSWTPATSERLGWLLAGRCRGPVFLTERRAPAGIPPADVCPLTGRARMSYRRAAEIFTTATRPLDPAGRGWTLHQLGRAGWLAPGR